MRWQDCWIGRCPTWKKEIQFIRYERKENAWQRKTFRLDFISSYARWYNPWRLPDRLSLGLWILKIGPVRGFQIFFGSGPDRFETFKTFGLGPRTGPIGPRFWPSLSKLHQCADLSKRSGYLWVETFILKAWMKTNKRIDDSIWKKSWPE